MAHPSRAFTAPAQVVAGRPRNFPAIYGAALLRWLDGGTLKEVNGPQSRSSTASAFLSLNAYFWLLRADSSVLPFVDRLGLVLLDDGEFEAGAVSSDAWAVFFGSRVPTFAFGSNPSTLVCVTICVERQQHQCGVSERRHP